MLGSLNAAPLSSEMNSRRLMGRAQTQGSRPRVEQLGPCIAAKAGRLCLSWVIRVVDDPALVCAYFRYTPKPDMRAIAG